MTITACCRGKANITHPVFRVRGPKPWTKNTIESSGKHSSDAITDQSIEWLDSGWDRSKPFFLMHHYKAPHDYFDNAERYDNYLADIDIPEPATLHSWNAQFGSLATRGDQDELTPHIGTSIGGRNPRRSYLLDLPKLYPAEFPPKFDASQHEAQVNRRLAYNAYLKKYLRCVKGVDDNLGRLFARLESLGVLDNTVILYTGDQGFMLGEHDYQDKRWMYEESQRMPLLVRYPKSITAGTRIEAIVENVDFGPTMLAFAGAEIPGSVQGRSFRDIVESGREPDDWKQAAYYRYWMHMAHHDNPAHVGIRTKSHKLIFYYGCNYDGGYRTPPAWELYDLARDPHETRNVYDDPEYAAVARRLKAELAELRTSVGDDGSHYPECEKVVREFWDYSDEDRAKARELSHRYRERRTAELKANRRNIRTHKGR